MDYHQYELMREKAIELFEKADIILTKAEKETVEVADFGLGKIENTGLQLITYVNTDKVCAKELALMPFQSCPEHRHPPREYDDGKEETFRCRYGKVYLYLQGMETEGRTMNPPKGDEAYYTAFKEIVLTPGEQYTIFPNTLHWFVAGDEGAVISEFSTKSTDESDIFTDPRINRIQNVDY